MDDISNGRAVKKRGLGRGLNALFEDEESVYPQADPDGHIPGRSRRMVPIDQLERNFDQPRRVFDDETLAELAESIRAHGLLQPILVRPSPGGAPDRYQIVAGERRWRASQQAQLHEVPVVVHELGDAEALEIALIENLQREDLNPLDEGQGYRHLMEHYGYTQEKLAKALGKSRSHIANMIRLLSLPAAVQSRLLDGQLSIGHARALITAEDPAALAREVIAKNLTVRETEALAAGEAQLRKSPQSSASDEQKRSKDVDTLALEEEISRTLGMKVTITGRGQKGALKIQYQTLDQLDDLLSRLTGG